MGKMEIIIKLDIGKNVVSNSSVSDDVVDGGDGGYKVLFLKKLLKIVSHFCLKAIFCTK